MTSGTRFAARLRGDAAPRRPGRQPVPMTVVWDEQRQRMLAAMADAAAADGYAGTTVADIVRRAQVSRRTFYEHFPDRAACLVACCDVASELQVESVRAAVGGDAGTPACAVARLADAYVDVLALEPSVSRVFLVDMLALGQAGLAPRRRSHERFIAVVHRVVEEHGGCRTRSRAADTLVATATIGAINELAVQALTGADPRRGLEAIRAEAGRILQAFVPAT